jgi:hypothetical protein
MGELRERMGRSANGGRRGLLAALTGTGIMAVALVMILVPASAAVAGNIVLHPKYKGAVAPENGYYINGCGKVSITKPWKFKLSTGVGGAETTGRSVECKNSPAGISTYNYADSNGGFTVALPIKVSSSTTNVSENLVAKYAVSLTASDGYKASSTGPCSAAPYIYTDSGTYLEWGGYQVTYTYGNFSYNYTYFPYYNDTYSYDGNSYSYGYGTVPSPFNYNNTTYYDSYSFYEYDSSCSADAYGSLYSYTYLVDETNGSTMIPSSNTFGTPYTYYLADSQLFDAQVTVENTTFWYCDSYTNWDGYGYGSSPSLGQGVWSNSSYCYNGNTTLTSYVYNYVPSFTSSTGTNNTQTWSSTTASTGTVSFTGTFVGTDKYYLETEVYAYFDTDNSWAKGYGAFAFNMATAGNGFKIASISIT